MSPHIIILILILNDYGVFESPQTILYFTNIIIRLFAFINIIT